MTKKIAITGGIGSGKTTLVNYIKSKGIPVYIADDEASKLMQSQDIIDAIKRQFGSKIFNQNILDRKALANIVFKNPEELSKLNQIIHPAVSQHFEYWLNSYITTPIIVYESALLFETGTYKLFDVVITVTAPIDIRIQRVMARDHIPREAVLDRMSKQLTDEQMTQKSDFVIDNIDINLSKLLIDDILKFL